MRPAYLVLSALLLGLACNSKHQGLSPDAGTPTSPTNAGPDAAEHQYLSPDAGIPASPTDAGPDAAEHQNLSPDTGTPASPTDAGPDAPSDGSLGGNAPINYRFSADVLVKGCAKALACSTTGQTTNEGITHCAEVVNWMGSADWGRNTFVIAAYDDNDWLLLAGLMQNMDCVQAASSCQAVLACVNQGQANATCTQRASHSLGRYCNGTTHLHGCSLGIEASIDCAKLGLSCVEVSAPDGSETMASCASPASTPGSLESLDVTCQGTMAQFSLGAARFGFDCSFIGSSCVPGSYALSSNAPFCVGAGSSTCQKNTSNRCDGDAAVLCFGGHEGGMACANIGATCNTDYPGTNPHCGFACANTSDTCTDGVINYCGPSGVGTLDCKSLGFSGCQLALSDDSKDPARASCVP